MVSPYHSIIEYQENKWEYFLQTICLIDIFLPVIKEYKEPSTISFVVKYIVFTYSPQSDKVILGMEWQKNKQAIFEFVMAKPMKNLYEDLVLLKNEKVVDSIHKWLEFHDQDTHKQLCVLRDLRVEMQLSAVSKILKSSGEYDFDQKMKNAEYATRLKGMIKDLESELIQNSAKLKDANVEIQKAASGRKGNTIGVEMFAT